MRFKKKEVIQKKKEYEYKVLVWSEFNTTVFEYTLPTKSAADYLISEINSKKVWIGEKTNLKIKTVGIYGYRVSKVVKE